MPPPVDLVDHTSAMSPEVLMPMSDCWNVLPALATASLNDNLHVNAETRHQQLSTGLRKWQWHNWRVSKGSCCSAVLSGYHFVL